MYVFVYACVYVCIYGLPTRVRLLRVKPPSLAHARAWAWLLIPPPPPVFCQNVLGCPQSASRSVAKRSRRGTATSARKRS